MVTEPVLHADSELYRAALVWRWASPMTALSSAPVGGGLQAADWLMNIGVPADYGRTDLADHAEEAAAELGLAGRGVGLFTAADVSQVRRAARDGVAVDATVGITKPTWAADSTGGYTPWAPGTINLVVQLPICLMEGAGVNAVMTATEAKSQALHEAGVPGTGTASDAVVIVWPSDGEAAPFAGPRSEWGARIAQATHAAVSSGIGRTSALPPASVGREQRRGTTR